MKRLAISFLSLFTLSALAVTECHQVNLKYLGKNIQLCHDKQADSYLSTECKNVKTCFFDKDVKLIYNANQSPGFSLCFQLGGRPFFGKIKEVEDKIPFCFKNGHLSDQESLLLYYRDYVFTK